MAVETRYMDADIEAGKKGNSAKSSGAGVRKFVAKEEVVSGASANSIYKFGADIGGNVIITSIKLSHDAFGSGALANIGIYKRGTFTAKDADVFGAGIDLSSAGKEVDGMEQLDINSYDSKLWELSGDSLDEGSYDLGIILTNVGATGAGTLVLEVEYIEGN